VGRLSQLVFHLTLLACISALGDALTPRVITGVPIRDSICYTELGQNEYRLLWQRSPPDLDEKLFFKYIADAVVLMDPAPAHRSDRVLRGLGENDILTVACPGYTTNMSQALNLVFLGAMKC
jgi:hypothetical protein